MKPCRNSDRGALRRIGAGGIGEVWLAERNDAEFEQQAAVKQLAWPTPGCCSVFARNARSWRACGTGHRPADRRRCRRARRSVPRDGICRRRSDHAVRERPRARSARTPALFLRICATVQYAHQNLVVHRDLKPSNILVGADGSLKLLDFGIAKVLATTDEAAQTQTAARLLTPDYAAPEQFSGDAITTATDVYALGVVLYELLADARPPRRVLTGAAADIEAPPPPSTAGDRNGGVRLGDGAARRSRCIALTALEAAPQRRYASAEACRVIRAISTACRSGAPREPLVRFRKFALRNDTHSLPA
jgi:serine/threonine-protein kinase